MGIEPRFYQVEKDGPVIVWKFSNPPRNLATIETGEELVQLVEEFDKDPELRVGIVTSATPGMFIQHFDVSLIVDWAEAMNKASEEEIAQQLAAKPPLAVENIKKAIYQGSHMTLQDGLILERELFFEAMRSHDAIQIMRLYVAAGQDREKEMPDFKTKKA